MKKKEILEGNKIKEEAKEENNENYGQVDEKTNVKAYNKEKKRS